MPADPTSNRGSAEKEGSHLALNEVPRFQSTAAPDLQLTPQQKQDLQVQEMSRLLLEHAGDGIYGLDPNGCVTFVNRAALEMTGWTREEVCGRLQHELVHHSHRDGSRYNREECPIHHSLRGAQSNQRENEVFWRKDGTWFPVSYTSTPVLLDGTNVGAVVIFRDITLQVQTHDWERQKSAIFASIVALEPLSETLSLIAGALNQLRPSFAVAILAREGDFLRLRGESNLPSGLQAAIAIIPLVAKTQLCGRVVLERTAMLEERTFSDAGSDAASTKLREWSLPLRAQDGETLGALSIFGQIAVRDQEQLAPVAMEAAELARLALEHSRLQHQLAHQAQHDALTGLPNRILLEDRLERAIGAAKRAGTEVAVCYLDLDRFKQINDTMGHGIGDRYLQQIAATLSANSREVDTLARQGGDEFILVLPGLNGPEEALAVGQRMLQQLGTPFVIDGLDFSASASIGISFYPRDGDRPLTLLQHADTALYAAKRGGRNQVRLFNPALGVEVQQSSRMQAGLHQALAKNQLSLVYQPIYGTDGELEGLEALLRWHDPNEGNIPPARFIPVAEESGLIVPIGAWVLYQACRQMAVWQEEGLARTRLFVNISGVQLNRDDFADTVASALLASGLDPALLGLEITETWIVADPQAASERLLVLRRLGVTISVDDFGTGQSSFAYLHALPLDTLKIDQAFIARLDGNPHHLSTVRAIINLARQLGLRTVAEGVETEQQLQYLRGVECDSIQGFLLSKPVSPEQAATLLGKQTIGLEAAAQSSRLLPALK